MGGGGVDGAIHRKGGPAILEACRRLRAERYPGWPPHGPGGGHAGRTASRPLGHPHGRPRLLAAGGSLGAPPKLPRRVAPGRRRARLRDVAFPAISTGVYGYPLDLAAPVAIAAVGRPGRASPRSASSCSTRRLRRLRAGARRRARSPRPDREFASPPVLAELDTVRARPLS